MSLEYIRLFLIARDVGEEVEGRCENERMGKSECELSGRELAGNLMMRDVAPWKAGNGI